MCHPTRLRHRLDSLLRATQIQLQKGFVQITNIRIVKEAMQEAAYMLAELALMGAQMAYLDVGGGLAIDYDGSKSDTSNSLSYTMQQYANDVVATVQA